MNRVSLETVAGWELKSLWYSQVSKICQKETNVQNAYALLLDAKLTMFRFLYYLVLRQENFSSFQGSSSSYF